MTYAEFIASKRTRLASVGFKPLFLPDCLKPFQHMLVDWAVRLGRAAIYADCGL